MKLTEKTLRSIIREEIEADMLERVADFIEGRTGDRARVTGKNKITYQGRLDIYLNLKGNSVDVAIYDGGSRKRTFSSLNDGRTLGVDIVTALGKIR